MKPEANDDGSIDWESLFVGSLDDQINIFLDTKPGDYTDIGSLDGWLLGTINQLGKRDGENYSDNQYLWDIHLLVNHWSELVD